MIQPNCRPPLLFLWLALVVLPWTAFAQDSLTLPLVDHVRDGRRVGYWLPVEAAGGAPAYVLLDTGSRGLMVKADRLGNQPVRWTGMRAKQVFLDGTVFEGEIALAYVRLGPAGTARPVSILAVKTIGCQSGKPDCPGRGWINSPLAGVLGVGFGSDKRLDNPLATLPANLASGFIIRGGGHSSASLTLGLTPENRKGFVFPPMAAAQGGGRTFYDLNSLGGCFSFGQAAERYTCGGVLFDSGSSWSFLHVPSQFLPSGLLPDGSLSRDKTVHLSMPGLPEYHATIGLLPWTDRVKVVPSKDGKSILGAGFLRDFDLLYDLRRQAIGLRPSL